MSHRSYEEIAIDPWGDYRGIIVDSGWTIDGFLTYIQSLLTPHEPSTDRRDIPVIPMGPPDILPIPPEPRNELPDMGTPNPQDAIPQEAIYREISTRVDETGRLMQDIWEVTVGGGNTYRGTLEQLGTLATHPDIRPVNQQLLERADDILTTPIGDVEAEEVTDFFHDLGDAAIGALMSQFGPGTTIPVGTGGVGVTTIETADIVNQNPAVASAVCNTGASPVYKKVCGVYKWVYPKRRRRRALLTESDYNALLRVQNLKVNQNMTVAIAKALTR